MTTYLGTPYERGKTDLIVTRLVDAPVEEGLFVYESAENKVAKMTASKTPFGVMGLNEIAGASVVVSGMKVKVQIETGSTPTVGGQVFIDATSGKATTTETSNIATNATFASATIEEDGVSNNTSTKSKNLKCVLINFAGGL